MVRTQPRSTPAPLWPQAQRRAEGSKDAACQPVHCAGRSRWLTDDRCGARAPERKVRTPSGSMPRKRRGGAGRKPGAMESVTENKPPTIFSKEKPRVRVKRRGKSPPPAARAAGHDKPHAVQDKTGKTGRRPAPRKRGNSRVLVALPRERSGTRKCSERNDHPNPRATAEGQNSAYRPPQGRRSRKRGRLRFWKPSSISSSASLSRSGRGRRR